jgi:hypothetical protein
MVRKTKPAKKKLNFYVSERMEEKIGDGKREREKKIVGNCDIGDEIMFVAC